MLQEEHTLNFCPTNVINQKGDLKKEYTYIGTGGEGPKIQETGQVGRNLKYLINTLKHEKPWEQQGVIEQKRGDYLKRKN